MTTHHMHSEYSWRGPEFLYKKKTILWYTNVGVFFFLVFLVLLWLENIFGMAVLAFALWLFLTKANERPRIVDYKIDTLGVHIDDRTFHFDSFNSFSIEIIGTNAVITLDPTEMFVFPTNLVIKVIDLDKALDVLETHLPGRTNYSLLHKITHHLHY